MCSITPFEALLGFAGLLIGSAVLAYGLYMLGRFLGLHPTSQRYRWVRLILIGGFFVGLGVSAGFVPERFLDRATVAAYVILVTAIPMCLGFANGLLSFQEENRRRITRRTDEWLAQWEREHEKAFGSGEE